jgi:hypothetical protein
VDHQTGGHSAAIPLHTGISIPTPTPVGLFGRQQNNAPLGRPAVPFKTLGTLSKPWVPPPTLRTAARLANSVLPAGGGGPDHQGFPSVAYLGARRVLAAVAIVLGAFIIGGIPKQPADPPMTLGNMRARYCLMCGRRRRGSYQSRRPVSSIAAIQPKSKEFLETLSSRIAAPRSSAFVRNLGASSCMNLSNQSRQRTRSSLARSESSCCLVLPLTTRSARFPLRCARAPGRGSGSDTQTRHRARAIASSPGTFYRAASIGQTTG